jgi:hypothetical protein
MEWLALFALVFAVIGAVVWLANRAVQRRRTASEVEDPHADVMADTRSGPRHFDVRDGGTPSDGGDGSP